ncbi:MAG: hypothetical protein JOZ41_22965 [Chloroflexi bacterium]|nr:hypothetical protein [Chloroflexota bacterium]
MAERARTQNGRTPFPRPRDFGTAAGRARHNFEWAWSRESLLRLALSFVLATALWLYVTDKQSPVQAWDYPYAISVNPTGVPGYLTVINSVPSVHLRIEANRNTTPVNPSSFYAFVDLSHYRRGSFSVPVKVSADPGIQVLSVTPPRVSVVVDTLQQKHVPVRYHLFGKPPAGYSLSGVTVTPNTVTVSGAGAALARVAQAAIYLDLSGATSPVGGMYPVSLETTQQGSIQAHLSVQPAEVHVQVQIGAPSTGKTVPVIAAVSGQPQSGLGVAGISTMPSTVTVYGSPAAFKGLSSLLTAPVSVSKRGAGTLTAQVKLRLPRGLHASASQVTVSVNIRPVSATAYAPAAVTAQKLPSGETVQIRPPTVIVELAGPPASASPGQVKAQVDLTGLGPGRYSLSPHLILPRGWKATNIYPARVAVSVARH